ncbi:MAG: hypothetical protein PHT97_11390, partial [Methanoculleus sp.]|uniref:hypothetical protein n=1 Tax=Methanoculleus sp. TaxID=90427 RepID=UPI002620E741
MYERVGENGTTIFYEVDEYGMTVVGGIDEWGNWVDRSGRVFVGDTVGVNDTHKHGLCFTLAELLQLHDKLHKYLVRITNEVVSVVEAIRKHVIHPAIDEITILQSIPTRFTRRSFSEMIITTD